MKEYKGLKFESDWHYELFTTMSVRLKCGDVYYDSLAYCLSLTGKQELLHYLDSYHVGVGGIKKAMGVYSSGEKAMIKLGLQLFNSSNYKTVNIADICESAGSWIPQILNVLAYRYL
ncbi:MAG TPA: hypothetical protein VK190_11350 [Pseudoneobacillus sp.]|nr:hypothetical protein [Pseudoneobacillus sp.]